MNSKANLPIVLLVLGIFGVCSLALLTFYMSDLDISNSFAGIDVLHKMDSVINEYKFYVREGMNPENVGKVFEDFEGLQIIEEDGRKFFYMNVSESKFVLSEFRSKDFVLFSVKYPIPS
jgi:hypothetical protein